jgi:hypothetical protein
VCFTRACEIKVKTNRRLLCVGVEAIVMSFFMFFIMSLMERLSNKLKTYLPHLPLMGLGVERLYVSTVTFLGPGLPTLSGLHLMVAKLHTSFQTISDRPVVKRLNQSDSLGTLRRSIEDINLHTKLCKLYIVFKKSENCFPNPINNVEYACGNHKPKQNFKTCLYISHEVIKQITYLFNEVIKKSHEVHIVPFVILDLIYST